ncbi:hypothetical protein GmHk_01G001292 [Glycine max]|nr:hypothetical protein GmHk_01G001292 [Glycine max]
MREFGTMAAHPGELMLSPEKIGSPNRAGSFSPKQFGAPSEPKASLGEPRLNKKFCRSVDLEPLAKPIIWLSEPSAKRSSSWLST